eukprot:gene4649-6533_t
METNNQKLEFDPPEFWSFRPFFTIQPVQATKEKQLKLWRELVLQYCMYHNIYRLVPTTFSYFTNNTIDRSLSPDAINEVVLSLIKAGNAEWEDASNTTLMIIWKNPEIIASEIYTFANTCGEPLGTVFTLYELLSGEDYQNTAFYGIDPTIFRRALQVLETNRKCQLIRGATPDEDGVKFLAV